MGNYGFAHLTSEQSSGTTLPIYNLYIQSLYTLHFFLQHSLTEPNWVNVNYPTVSVQLALLLWLPIPASPLQALPTHLAAAAPFTSHPG